MNMAYDILVNKDNPISKDYKIDNLVLIGKHYSGQTNDYTDKDVQLESKTAENLSKMLVEIHKIFPNYHVIPNSGYRSLQYQIDVMNYYIEREGIENAKKELMNQVRLLHHTGLAIDLAVLKDGIYLVDLTEANDLMEYIYIYECS